MVDKGLALVHLAGQNQQNVVEEFVDQIVGQQTASPFVDLECTDLAVVFLSSVIANLVQNRFAV